MGSTTLCDIFDLGLSLGTLEERVVVSIVAPVANGLLVDYLPRGLGGGILTALRATEHAMEALVASSSAPLAKALQDTYAHGVSFTQAVEKHFDGATDVAVARRVLRSLEEDAMGVPEAADALASYWRELAVVGAMLQLRDGVAGVVALAGATAEQAFEAGEEAGHLVSTPRLATASSSLSPPEALFRFVHTNLVNRPGGLLAFRERCKGLGISVLKGPEARWLNKLGLLAAIEDDQWHREVPFVWKGTWYGWTKVEHEDALREQLEEDVESVRTALAQQPAAFAAEPQRTSPATEGAAQPTDLPSSSTDEEEDLRGQVSRLADDVKQLRDRGPASLKPAYSVKEAASLLGRSEQTVRRWIREGKLESAKSADSQQGRHMISYASIKRLLEG